MGKTKFTPGPWDFGKDRRWLFRDNLKHDGNFSSTTILKVDDDAFRPTDANAHLIAAAPELYEVLAKFMDFKDSDYVPNNLFERARSVLNKARGETHPSGGDRHGE